jgi:hypothetical protein
MSASSPTPETDWDVAGRGLTDVGHPARLNIDRLSLAEMLHSGRRLPVRAERMRDSWRQMRAAGKSNAGAEAEFDALGEATVTANRAAEGYTFRD